MQAEGFGAVELLISLIVVIIIGLMAYVGWRHLNNRQQHESSSTSTNTTHVSDSEHAATEAANKPINNKQDLEDASSALDKVDIEAGDSKQLDSALNNL